MQDYIGLANKNGVTLFDQGKCQFFGANTEREVHECLEIFELGFQEIDFSKIQNHIYRFFIVDAHTLQHPELHGRWSNHFHLSRLHLIFHYNVNWTYDLSPQLSNNLNTYKNHKSDEYLTPPELLKRGQITTTDIKEKSYNELECKAMIRSWVLSVYEKWSINHGIVDEIGKGFLNGRK